MASHLNQSKDQEWVWRQISFDVVKVNLTKRIMLMITVSPRIMGSKFRGAKAQTRNSKLDKLSPPDPKRIRGLWPKRHSKSLDNRVKYLKTSRLLMRISWLDWAWGNSNNRSKNSSWTISIFLTKWCTSMILKTAHNMIMIDSRGCLSAGTSINAVENYSTQSTQSW